MDDWLSWPELEIVLAIWSGIDTPWFNGSIMKHRVGGIEEVLEMGWRKSRSPGSLPSYYLSNWCTVMTLGD